MTPMSHRYTAIDFSHLKTEIVALDTICTGLSHIGTTMLLPMCAFYFVMPGLTIACDFDKKYKYARHD